MREQEQILELWHQMQAKSSQGVLATVVKTLGSSYRRPGARLLLTQDGKRAGSISGGCLEDEVVKRAWWFTEKGPMIRRYDTTPDGEIGPTGEQARYGLGCNGIIYLLLERVTGSDGEWSPLAVMDRVHQSRQTSWMATVLDPAKDAAKRFIREGPEWRPPDDELALQIDEASRDLTGSAVLRLDSAVEVFLEMLMPPLRLLIFGAGDDAIPLTEFGRQLGWHVSVLDGRAHYARREKFPLANEVLLRESSRDLQDLNIDSRTVAVVMTHSYSQDSNFVVNLAKAPLAYLGVLGPRNRSMQILSEAGIQAGAVPFLHGPVGLDIGADGPEQVALSIVAEIQATLNARDGGPLRLRAGSIHSSETDGTNSERFTPSIVCA